MLFNSPVFIFLFLPLTIFGYFCVWRTSSSSSAKLFLITASLVFYGWWNPLNLPVIGVSVAFNYLIGSVLLNKKLSLGRLPPNTTLVVGIIFNLGLLGYFKYLNFSVNVFNHLFEMDIGIGEILLPLGISFFTFQQIGFLIDANARQIKAPKFLDYVLFVTFFPQLIAGPIVQYREMMPQFARPFLKGVTASDFSVGLTLFIIGFFKKTVLADLMMLYSDMTFNAAAQGHAIEFLESWGGAIAFSLQLYFDFSGYSDMAVGLGRMVGICVPLNFNSPYIATSVIEFWTRWHMTLTRFFNAYVYSPITLQLTRMRLASGKGVLAERLPGSGAFAYLIAFPTISTMFLIGIWHGADYTFALLGVFHGVALVMNHVWRVLRGKFTLAKDRDIKSWKVFCMFLTFLVVTSSFVLFRSENLSAALNMYEGMLGISGFALPPGIVKLIEFWGVNYVGTVRALMDYQFFWTAALLLVVFVAPNSQEILISSLNQTRTESSGKREEYNFYNIKPQRFKSFTWQPNRFWGLCIGVVASIALFSFSDSNAFVYFEF